MIISSKVNVAHAPIQFGDIVKLNNDVPAVPLFSTLLLDEFTRLEQTLTERGIPARVVNGKTLNKSKGAPSLNEKYLIFDGKQNITLSIYNDTEETEEISVDGWLDENPAENTDISEVERKRLKLEEFMQDAAQQLGLFKSPVVQADVDFGPTRKYTISGKKVDGDFKIKNMDAIVQSILDLKA